MSKRIAASTLLVSALMLSALSGAAVAVEMDAAGRPSQPAFQHWQCRVSTPSSTFPFTITVLARSKHGAERQASLVLGKKARVFGCRAAGKH